MQQLRCAAEVWIISKNITERPARGFLPLAGLFSIWRATQQNHIVETLMEVKIKEKLSDPSHNKTCLSENKGEL